MFRKSILVQQRDITDCGAASLASVAAYYHSYVPVSTIRLNAGTDQSGTSMSGLIQAAHTMGFRSKAAKGDATSLAKIPFPTIAHVVKKNGLHHYVVLYRISKKFIWLMDPADGKMHKTAIQFFLEEWSGILLLLLPGDGFIQQGKKISTLRHFLYLIQPYRMNMLQALTGAIVYTVLGLSLSIYVQKIIDGVLVDGNLNLLRLLSIGMLVILLFQWLIGHVKSVIALQTGLQMDIRLIFGYYRHLLSLPQRFFDNMRTGEILSRINDAVKIRVFINDIALNLLVNLLIIFFSLLLMFFYYWKLALITLIIIPVYMVLYLISHSIHKKWQRKLMEQSAHLENQLVESIDAASTIKQFGIENFVVEKTEQRLMSLMKTIYSSSIYALYISNSTEFFTKLYTVLLLWAGSYFVIHQELTPGELLSFYALIGYFTSPVSYLIGANKMIQDALIASERLFEITGLEAETTVQPYMELHGKNAGDIRFHDVSFSYGSRQPVFEKLSLMIPKGQSTAIIGESGSGKSTLLALLQNLYPLNNGQITIGGQDLRHIDINSLRRTIAVVPQKIDLFAGTISDNIALGEIRPDFQKIHFVAELVGIHSFIEKLPEGYATILNEQGVNLSGGQRQRLAIARALYREPEILILDEATSHLDSATELQVQQAFNWWLEKGKTLIIIAHRLTTIRNCHTILVLNKGMLVEQGNHSNLMKNKGYYANLWEKFAAIS